MSRQCKSGPNRFQIGHERSKHSGTTRLVDLGFSGGVCAHKATSRGETHSPPKPCWCIGFYDQPARYYWDDQRVSREEYQRARPDEGYKRRLTTGRFRNLRSSSHCSAMALRWRSYNGSLARSPRARQSAACSRQYSTVSSESVISRSSGDKTYQCLWGGQVSRHVHSTISTAGKAGQRWR